MSLRSLSCELSLLARSDGSARFKHGETSVLVSVYGPGQVKPSREILNKATLEVHLKPKTGLPGYGEKALEKILRDTCEAIILTSLHPRSSILIILQVEHDDGSLLSCCLNACCVALMDAGVPMRGLVCAVSCAVSASGEQVIDPTLEQEQAASAVLTFGFSTNSDIITSHMTGQISQDKFYSTLSLASSAGKAISDFYRSSAEKKLSKVT
ncbi:exosome complex component RRP46-like [Corticium candelabrum]|uniref:exosome complex component RRP46-like n=1 Tax=Corticium candelabrum TaxID=121492 RepID=UPI002E255309|nr:exosome complex component RRP46-like [Corticium candelabrum]